MNDIIAAEMRLILLLTVGWVALGAVLYVTLGAGVLAAYVAGSVIGLLPPPPE